jgi:hypothetical protein
MGDEEKSAAPAVSPVKEWDTTIKLASIEEASFVVLGAVVHAVDRASGEVTIRSATFGGEKPSTRAWPVDG